jgi:hypothetical protein
MMSMGKKTAPKYCRTCGGTGLAYGSRSGELIRCQRCNAIISIPTSTGVQKIEVEGNFAEVQEVAAHLLAKVQTQAPLRNAWANGSFYLAMALAMITLVFVISKNVPVWTFVGVIVGGVLLSTLIGALQLRHDDRVSEKGFLELVKITFANLPLLRMVFERRSAAIQPAPADRSNAP